MNLFRRRTSLTCQRAIALLTDYLDEALPQPQRRNLEGHLRDCAHCSEYLTQLQATIDATGRVGTGDLTPDMRDELISLYRKTMNGKS